MSDYIQLDMEYKRELLVNFQFVMFAYLALEHISGASKEDWMKQKDALLFRPWALLNWFGHL